MRRLWSVVAAVASMACGTDVYESKIPRIWEGVDVPPSYEEGDECRVDCDCAGDNPCVKDSCEHGFCVVRMRDAESCEDFAGSCRGGWCCTGDACFEPHSSNAQAACAASIDDPSRQ